MNLDEQLLKYNRQLEIQLREEHIQKTVEMSKEIFLAKEQESTLSYLEFLYSQFHLVRKKWWLFQTAILTVLWAVLPLLEDSIHVYRGMSVVAVLFIILIIPELWKNRTNHSMEIEAVTYYSLRQIYAARMLLFGIIDILIITVFCGAASFSLQITFIELMVQFLFPMVVTACICFGTLCSNYAFNEAMAVGMCMIWSAIWWFVLLDERIYATITIPMWLTLFGFAIVFLAFAVYKSMIRCNEFWEVSLYGIENE